MGNVIVRLPLYNSFVDFTPVLPNYYWNVYSSEERIKAICLEICKLIEYANEIGKQTNINTDDIDELQSQFEKFMESGFDDYYARQIEEWINNNVETIINDIVTMVFFGLTTDGYFVAYVPDSWEDIRFTTNMEYGTYEYGRLILEYDVDWPHNVDQSNMENVDASIGG